MKALTLAFLTLISLQASARNSGAQSQQVLTGVYWTPVPAELSQFAVFNIPEVRVRKFLDKVKVTYDLPVELTGNPNHIELEGPADVKGPVVLSGRLGVAECPSANDYSTCKLFYNNLDIDPKVRTELLKQIVKSPDELVLREAVAARFCVASTGGEPCGFLRILNYKSSQAETKY